jgi:hypothetical protein
MRRVRILLVLTAASIWLGVDAVAAEKPHAVFVVGTPHYNPAATMPPLAKQLERFGFRVTVILPEGNPEMNKNGKGLPGLEVLKEADVAIFFLRFL